MCATGRAAAGTTTARSSGIYIAAGPMVLLLMVLVMMMLMMMIIMVVPDVRIFLLLNNKFAILGARFQFIVSITIWQVGRLQLGCMWRPYNH